MHTNLTMNRTIRKFVTFIAFVACFALFPNCQSKQEEADTSSKQRARTSVPIQKSKTDIDTAVNDTLAGTGLSITPDTGYADSATLVDSAVNSLPLPEKETEIEWETDKPVDTLQAESDTQIIEKWTDESEGVQESEFIDYSAGDVALNKERILKTEIVKVIMPDFQDDRDSVLAVIEERMSLNPNQISKQIVVEKWFSPVNYRGYKFNRKKLMLYGVEKETLISIYFYLDEYYFGFNQTLYNLDESTRNVSLVSVKDTVLTNYLLKYED